MGQVLKFSVKPLTLDDKTTKDGLEAVATLTGKEPYYLVGGVATQSFLPTRCRRPTSDIDLSIVRPLNYEDFRNMAVSVKEYLGDNHYEITERKTSGAYKLLVEKTRNPEEKLLIEFSRRNKQSFGRAEERLRRELENAKSKILEERKCTYIVSAPEDIVVPKLVRDINSIIRNPELRRLIHKKRQLSGRGIEDALKFIKDLREQAVLEPTNLELAEELRLISDIYDIRILSEIAGLNTSYFSIVCNDWSTITKGTKERDLLFEATLPDFIPHLPQHQI